MDIIEKQVEKIKEVPYGYWENCEHGCNYNRGFRNSFIPASRGVAGAALGIGIGGLVLAGANWLRNNRGFNLFGNNNGTPENVNINNIGGGSNGYSLCSPTAFQAWEKSCEDAYREQKALYDYALLDANTRFNDRQTLNGELFGVYKSQIDADFGLYKSTRDADDALAARISALETKQAVNDAVDPWRAKVLDMKINGVAANAQASVALEAERRCCADNKIVSYVNGNFYPVSVADVTTGTTTTARTTYNPLCNCCTPCFNV